MSTTKLKKRAADLGPRQATAFDRALGEQLRYVRLRQGVSQEALAEALGITFQQVQKYEAGINRMSVERLVRACAALNCSLTYMLAVPMPERPPPLAPERIEQGAKR